MVHRAQPQPARPRGCVYLGHAATCQCANGGPVTRAPGAHRIESNTDLPADALTLPAVLNVAPH
jgi:hypothetical protein